MVGNGALSWMNRVTAPRCTGTDPVSATCRSAVTSQLSADWYKISRLVLLDGARGTICGPDHGRTGPMKRGSYITTVKKQTKKKKTGLPPSYGSNLPSERKAILKTFFFSFREDHLILMTSTELLGGRACPHCGNRLGNLPLMGSYIQSPGG